MNACHRSPLPTGSGSRQSETNRFNFVWFEHVKRSLVELNLPNLWYTNENAKHSRVVSLIKRQTKSLHRDRWLFDLANNSQCNVYRLHKLSWGMSRYLTILNTNKRVPLTKFLTRNHYLPINANMFKKQNGEVKPTTCPLCCEQAPGDEIHYLLKCSAFNKDRKRYPFLTSILPTESESEKFHKVFECDDYNVLSKLSKFIRKILSTFTPQEEEAPLEELPVRKTHVTRVGRTSTRPKYLNDFFV